MEEIYFSKIEFREDIGYSLHSIILLNLIEGTLAYQVYQPVKQKKAPIVKMKNQKTDFKPVLLEDDFERYDVVFSYTHKFSDDQKTELMSFCKVMDFEPYRDREMSMQDEGYCGYRDEVNLYFTGMTDSCVPVIKLPMSYYYDEEHIWPSEKLYRYIMRNYMSGKKLSKWVIPYGGLSLG